MSIKDQPVSCFQIDEEKAWNVLGHKYQPVIDSDNSYAWISFDPPGTFVPPHSHGENDEHIFVLEGEYELYLDGRWQTARAGDTVRWPKGSLHAYKILTDKPAKGIFWVSPAGQLSKLFAELHNVENPEEVVELSRKREIFFAKPGEAPGYK
ncbi:cupin domain-containing protein [Marinobacterium aestuariivivens]|uniref:Cupin domain-containing protein n=1 Tax=Marinobacterium aestuariivivens TaxID=1698799 RepID=A0ABW2AA39_9GAMM